MPIWKRIRYRLEWLALIMGFRSYKFTIVAQDYACRSIAFDEVIARVKTGQI